MLQVIVTAKDRGLPTSKQATNRATVVVTVVRNENDPIFFNKTYSAYIRQDVPAGQSVITVQASDSDSAVSIDTDI